MYRAIRILIVLMVTFIVTGSIGDALSISMLDAVVASVYYYYFDKYWYVAEDILQSIWFRLKY